MSEPDFLDELIAEGAKEDPSFPRQVEAGYRRRSLLRQLSDERKAQGLSQTKVAAAMGTSQSTLTRLENYVSDARLSTVDRFADALGLEVHYKLVRRAEPDSGEQRAA